MIWTLMEKAPLWFTYIRAFSDGARNCTSAIDGPQGSQRTQNYCLILSRLAGVIGNLINSLAWCTWAVVTMHCWTPLWTLLPPIELRGCWDEMQQSRTFTALRLVPLCLSRERGPYKFNHELSWYSLGFETCVHFTSSSTKPPAGSAYLYVEHAPFWSLPPEMLKRGSVFLMGLVSRGTSFIYAHQRLAKVSS